MHSIKTGLWAIVFSITLSGLIETVFGQNGLPHVTVTSNYETIFNAPDSLFPVLPIANAGNRDIGWNEIGTNTLKFIYCGPGCYYDPPLFFSLGQYSLRFLTGNEPPINMMVKFDNGDGKM